MRGLAIAGGVLQLAGLALGVVSLRRARGRFVASFDPDSQFTNAELLHVKGALRSLAYEGWTLGWMGVLLIGVGIVLTTISTAA